ncbi:glycosyltransferase family 1 protein [Cyanosarcina cf. burmensis CCALA 770]|nr:glycosyltransferase family 1 protein [Cyanosarcina cf. burmensis CCALA 770]
MNILYLGQAYGTSKHRVDALFRLGHNIKIVDPDSFLSKNILLPKWQWKTGGFFLENYIRRKVLSSIEKDNFDLVLVNEGTLVGAELVNDLKKFAKAVINYNNDDPFGGRDGNRWRLYLKAVPYYDMLVVVRESNVTEAYSLGAKKVIRVFMSADEIAHQPKSLTHEEYLHWASDILFIGTWMPERGPFMATLVEAGLPLTIYGDRWQKAKEWSVLQTAWKGNAIYGDDYAKAIQTAKISLGLLSKGNRDLHTTRSIEIPYLGGLLCAEHTSEHLKLYQEGKEAIFWSDVTECIEICQILLADEERRKKIATKGRIRCIQNGHLNEKVMSKITTYI